MFLLAVLLQQSVGLGLAERPEAASAVMSESAREGEVSTPEDGGDERFAEEALSRVGSEFQLNSSASDARGCWVAGLSQGRFAPRAPFKPPRA